MKAVIVSPYFETLGGGERYALSFAQALLDKGWGVEITINDNNVLLKARERFNLKLVGLSTISFNEIRKKYLKHRSYDLIFWVSDGSIPLMFGKKSILHFQVPFHDVGGKNLINKIKLARINKIVCNSIFTKNIIDKEYKINSDVWYPPVSVEEFSPAEKKNCILAVGRFEKSMTEKRQDVLIEVFKKMVREGLNNWKLILSGGCTDLNGTYLSELKKSASGFSVEFEINIPFCRLKELYSRSKIFWHAAGYQIDEEKYPERVEHFGMTTVEAMAAGCVPVVMAKGGQKEIVEQGVNGYLWLTESELLNKTLNLIGNEKERQRIGQKSVARSKDFSTEKFYEKIYSLIKG